jgi:hypothetical protein
LLLEDVGTEEDNDDGNNDGGDVDIVMFVVDVDNGYSIGVILVWCEG